MNMLLKWSILFLTRKFIYIHLFHCTIKNPKWPWTLKGQRYYIYTCFKLPLTSKFHSVFLYGHLFSSYMPFWGKGTEWPQMTLSSERSKADFRNCHIWAWNLATGKNSRSFTYTLFLPPPPPSESHLSLFSLYGQRFPRYRTIFKIAIFGHGTWAFVKSSGSWTFYPRGRNWPYFPSTGSGFRDTGRFHNCHICVWNLSLGQSSRSCICTP